MNVLKITYNELRALHDWIKANYGSPYFAEEENGNVHPRTIAWISPGHHIVGLDKLKRFFPEIVNDNNMNNLINNNTVDYNTITFPEE
jgi:hypothetical protein